MEPKPILCDDCGEPIPFPDIHFCACGAWLHVDCYFANHAAHNLPYPGKDHRYVNDDQEPRLSPTPNKR